MPNDTSFAVLYKKLVDHNFEADPKQLVHTRHKLVTLLSARRSPAQEEWTWTRTQNNDTSIL